MGKIIFFITTIILIDIILLGTGQLCLDDGSNTCGLSSVIFDAIINLKNLQFSQFFSEIIGDFANLASSGTGLAALIIGTAVSIGAVAVSSAEQRIYIPIAMTLGVIVGDFVFLFSRIDNVLLATIIFAPLTIAFILSILDWIRGKD